MKQIVFEPDFAAWQRSARSALAAATPPEEIVWTEMGQAQEGLDLFTRESAAGEAHRDPDGAFRVSRQFISSARVAALHSDATKWTLLYRMLWRLTHGEPRLMEMPTDADLLALQQLEKEVRKDAYRMHQYIRFRETTLDGEPWYIAWYEPEHDSISLNETFFSDRFTNMRWSILTPKRCMHWDGERIRYSAGVDKTAAPVDDQIEPLWVTYYSNIFNPARVKVKAMKAQMPVRNWKNLPEARAINSLLAQAPLRVHSMIERSESKRTDWDDYSIAIPPSTADWSVLRDAAATCRACPLWKNASCTVFGEGRLNASIMFVGEQPGDSEDRAGKPFIGPAGQVLDQALVKAGVNRENSYVTNAVKHFKWEPRGKRRIHKTPNAREIAACRPWLIAELELVQPRLIVALGATASRALFDEPVKIMQERGRIVESNFGPTLVTIHPSALLRLPPGVEFAPQFELFVRDLEQIKTVLAS